MVIDTSAFVAIFFAEPERQSFRNAIVAAETRFVSAVSLFETGVVLESRIGGGGGREFTCLSSAQRLRSLRSMPSKPS